MKIHVLQHVAFEGPAKIGDWAKRAGHMIGVSRLDRNEPVPGIHTADAFVIMGGPMGAMDDAQFPWMKAEKALIAEAIASGRKVLGVCLGAQLIAAALGAKVGRNREKEIGWFPIEHDPSPTNPLRVLPPQATVFHWHGDTFELPRGAVRLAWSAGCENQAFAVGSHVVGLQFHVEIGRPQVELLLRHAASDLTPGPYVQEPERMLAQASQFAPPLHSALDQFLDGFLGSGK
jgi:GMP synthase-like glutamine amidotransferase